jgi:chemotaxis protein MotB
VRSAEDKEPQHELVIIRRRAEHDSEPHKGGVWKIAYADFMTAMMAFFLVMWLINAANEETRSQVASYFNPVKLIDSRTNTKGLQDLDAGADGKVKPEPVTGKVNTEKESPPAPRDNKAREEALFRDPYSVLTEIAGPAEEEVHSDETKAGMLHEEANRSGRLGGVAYLDPFDPQTWQKVPSKKADFNSGTPSATDAKAKPVVTEVVPAEAEARQTANAKPEEIFAAKDQPPGQPKGVRADDKVAPTEGKPKEAAKIENPPAATAADAGQIEKEITKAVASAGPGPAPAVEVRGTKEGVLISLADSTGFGMFAIASAKPQAALVHYMEKIGAVLRTRPGTIIISGHTDGRPFRSDTYDNWRLSSARAQMAYYMLVRGGIDEKRVERIEGHADHDLKVPNDPEAAENRRIEILLRETKS